MTHTSSILPSKRPVLFGEVLFDCFPDGNHVLGGAPFNVAWHLQGFGAKPLLISRVGDDALGEQILQAMRDWGMDCTGIQQDHNYPTGAVNVHLEQGEPHFKILPDQAYDQIAQEQLPTCVDPALLYHGSLALRQPVSQASCVALRTGLAAPVFLDVNLRPPWWQPELLQQLLAQATWVKLNQAELATLIPAKTVSEQIIQIFQNYPNLQQVFLTLGAQGAAAYTPDGQQFSVQPETTHQVVDTVGAGDAFSSVLMMGLLSAWPIDLTLARAQQFASRIVEQQGATRQDEELYHDVLASWADE